MTSKHVIVSTIGALALATVVGCSTTIEEDELEPEVAPPVDTDTTTEQLAPPPNGHDGRCTAGELFIGCTQQQNGLYTWFCWCPQGTW